MQHFFKNNPMLILAFPLMVGIAVSWFLEIELFTGGVLLALSSVALVAAFIWQGAVRWLFGVVLVVAFFALGVFSEVLDRKQSEAEWSGTKGRFEALLLEAPHVGGRSTRVKAVVTRLGRDSLYDARREGVVYLYFENSVALESLTLGNRILFEGKVLPPRNAGNPAEFDTKHYMYVNGISGSAFLNNKGWRVHKDAPLTLSMRAMLLREKIVNMYASLNLRAESREILSALTVGEKRDLSKGMRNLYASVGASHILALSGLHLGILYMVFTILLPIGGTMALRVVREGVLLLLLWCFAAVAGFTPSVVRAAILFSLMTLARSMQRDSSSVNSLAFAALLMLVFNPRWLFDVSFQLSFSAVLSILLLVPYIDKLIGTYERGAIYRYVAGIFSVSVAAQIGTLPFLWYYFGSFPTYFIATNFVVVPAAFLIMLFAVTMLLLFPIDIIRNLLAFLLDNLIAFVNYVLRLIESLPFSLIELLHIESWVAFVVAFTLAVGLYAVVNRNRHCMAASLLATLFLVGHLYYASHRAVEPHIMFYNSRNFSAVQFVDSRSRSYLLSSYPQWEVDAQYIAEPYWRRENIAEPKLLADCCYNDYSDRYITLRGGLVTFGGRRMKILADEEWKADSIINPVDCILLCRGFTGNIKDVLLRYPANFIFMDGTLYAGSCKRILRECIEQKVRCINLRETGARKLLIDKRGVRVVSAE